MIHYQFSHTENKQFANTLRRRVKEFFSSQDGNTKANALMRLKSLTALSFFVIPYLLMVIFIPTNIYILTLLWIVMGFGVAFVGTTVMHDSLHGSFSRLPWVNKLVGSSSYFIGVDPTMWQLQHNVLHHTYTNIEHADEDIESRYVLRFSPHQPLRWFHKYQHLYAPFFYSLMTIIWVTVKDYIKAITYYNKGLIKSKADLAKAIIRIFLGKAFYFSLILVLPIYLLPFSAGTIVLLFLMMHAISGTLLSLIFQPAHVMSTTKFVEQEDQQLEENFMVHQLATTSNYGINDGLTFWFTGGLNHQVEHHLFPNICHVHYPELSEIVKETADEFGIPYYSERTFGSAISNHFKMLQALGNTK